MSQPNNDTKKLRGIFPVASKEPDNKPYTLQTPEVFSSDPQYYAVASEDQSLERFKLFLRSGKVHSIPYALLPVCTLDGDSLYIKSHELLIRITGRNLEPIEEHFSSRMLLWVKASPSGKDDGEASVFIKDIVATGKAIPASENL